MILKFGPSNDFLTLALPNGQRQLDYFFQEKPLKNLQFIVLDHNSHTESC